MPIARPIIFRTRFLYLLIGEENNNVDITGVEGIVRDVAGSVLGDIAK